MFVCNYTILQIWQNFIKFTMASHKLQYYEHNICIFYINKMLINCLKLSYCFIIYYFKNIIKLII